MRVTAATLASFIAGSLSIFQFLKREFPLSLGLVIPTVPTAVAPPAVARVQVSLA
jgi:hypothetical protein